MSKFSDLARLKKSIRKNRFECIGNMQEGVDFMCDAETAMPWLLAIAEAFQPGTGEVLRTAIILLVASGASEDCIVIDCLRRLQAAAEELEHDA